MVRPLAALVLLSWLCSCSDSGSTDPRVRGEQVYRANCVVCHHPDPREQGSLGPPVAGASRELLEARVIHGEYPAGYKPKRETRVMVPLPHLQAKLNELAAYLDSLN